MASLEITPAEVKSRLAVAKASYFRRTRALGMCDLEDGGRKHILLGALAASLPGLPDADEITCYCHHRMRTLGRRGLAEVTRIREGQIFERPSRALVMEIDPKVPRY